MEKNDSKYDVKGFKGADGDTWLCTHLSQTIWGSFFFNHKHQKKIIMQKIWD